MNPVFLSLLTEWRDEVLEKDPDSYLAHTLSKAMKSLKTCREVLVDPSGASFHLREHHSTYAFIQTRCTTFTVFWTCHYQRPRNALQALDDISERRRKLKRWVIGLHVAYFFCERHEKQSRSSTEEASYTFRETS